MGVEFTFEDEDAVDFGRIAARIARRVKLLSIGLADGEVVTSQILLMLLDLCCRIAAAAAENVAVRRCGSYDPAGLRQNNQTASIC